MDGKREKLSPLCSEGFQATKVMLTTRTSPTSTIHVDLGSSMLVGERGGERAV